MGKGGRPAHKRTDENVTLVQNCVLAGCTTEMAAKIVGVSEATLKRYYQDILSESFARANAKVAGTCLAMAISGRHPVMSIFWAKTKMGWRETDGMEHSGQIKVVFGDDDDPITEGAFRPDTDSPE